METTTKAKDRGILFKGEMVRAILSGDKTQTRRLVTPSPGYQSTWLTSAVLNESPRCYICSVNGKLGAQFAHPQAGKVFHGILIDEWSPLGWVKCPYGNVGDLLWVRETFTYTPVGHRLVYKADRTDWDNLKIIKWKPSLFMPREACRIRLEITDVRVERLQDISEDDAIAEGIGHAFSVADGVFWKNYLANEYWPEISPIDSYKTLWMSINGKDSWQANPWIWKISFKRI